MRIDQHQQIEQQAIELLEYRQQGSPEEQYQAWRDAASEVLSPCELAQEGGQLDIWARRWAGQ